MKTFTVNNVTYTSKGFTFNTVCELEEMGVSLQDITNKPMSMIRAYLAICANRDMEFAGEQIEAHVMNGGTFDAILEIIKDEMDASGFFQALAKTEEKTITTSKSKKSAQ